MPSTLLSTSVSRRLIAAAGVLAFSAACASANPIVFTGQDNGLTSAPPNPHPNSSAAAASFAAAAGAIGTVSTITLESAPLGSFTSLTVAPGVTLTGTDYSGNNQTIRNTTNFSSYPSVDGSNTTPGGSYFVEQQGGTVTFTFATPTQFFGAYLTGVQTDFFQDTFTFSDGTTMTINAPGAGTTGSIGATDFVGFTDAGKSISSVTINAGSPPSGSDFIGVDDVSFQSGPLTAATPEPSSFVLLLSGFGGLGISCRRFRRDRG